jgi:hypothetical protein
MDFWNSAEVGLKKKIIYTFAESTEFRAQNSAEFQERSTWNSGKNIGTA